MALPRISPHADTGMPQRLIHEDQLMLDVDLNFAAHLLGRYLSNVTGYAFENAIKLKSLCLPASAKHPNSYDAVVKVPRT
jgi:hypothetical protein